MQPGIILIPELDIKNRKRPSLTKACVLVMIASLGLWIAAIASELLLPDTMTATAREVCVNLLYYVPFMGIPAAVLMTRGEDYTDALRLGPLPVIKVFSIVLLALISTYFASLSASLWGMLLERFGLHNAAGGMIPETREELLLSVLTAAALPAVFEEFLYRGIVFSAWEVRGTKRAIVISSVLFALAHGNLFGLPVYLIVGALSAYLVFATDSVYAGMIFHTVYNSACLVLSYMTAAEAAEESMSGAEMLLSLAGDTLLLSMLTASTLLMMRVMRRLTGIRAIPKNPAPMRKSEKMILALTVAVMIPMLLTILLEGGAA